MLSEVKRVGKSLSLSSIKYFKKAGICPGDEIEVVVRKGEILIRKVSGGNGDEAVDIG